MKETEEPEALRNEVKTGHNHLAELTDDELVQVNGGHGATFNVKPTVVPPDTILSIAPFPYVILGPDWDKPDTKKGLIASKEKTT